VAGERHRRGGGGGGRAGVQVGGGAARRRQVVGQAGHAYQEQEEYENHVEHYKGVEYEQLHRFPGRRIPGGSAPAATAAPAGGAQRKRPPAGPRWLMPQPLLPETHNTLH